MSKKKTSLKAGVYYAVALVLALAAVAMIFLPNVKLYGVISETVHYTGNGLNAVFGYSDGSISVFSFSVMNLITYILPLAALVLVVLKMANVGKSNLLDVLAMIMLVVGGVFFFLVPTFAISEYANTANSLVHTMDKNLAIGAILGGIFSILGAVVLCLKLVLKKK